MFCFVIINSVPFNVFKCLDLDLQRFRFVCATSGAVNQRFKCDLLSCRLVTCALVTCDLKEYKKNHFECVIRPCVTLCG